MLVYEESFLEKKIGLVDGVLKAYNAIFKVEKVKMFEALSIKFFKNYFQNCIRSLTSIHCAINC